MQVQMQIKSSMFCSSRQGRNSLHCIVQWSTQCSSQTTRMACLNASTVPRLTMCSGKVFHSLTVSNAYFLWNAQCSTQRRRGLSCNNLIQSNEIISYAPKMSVACLNQRWRPSVQVSQDFINSSVFNLSQKLIMFQQIQ